MPSLGTLILVLAGAHAAPPANVVGGDIATGDPAIVALASRPLACGAEPEVRCTGVLIAPRVVLTAAHCVADMRLQWSVFDVYFGTDAAAHDGRWIPTTTALVHPDFDADSRAHDLALLLLAEPVEDIAPIALPAAPIGTDAVGTIARVVGFGVDDPDAAELRHHPNILKRSGTVRITEVGALTFRAEPAPSMTCVGDSGGPVFVPEGDGEALAGITSSGDALCASYAVNAMLAADVDGFVRPFLANAAEGADGWSHATVALDAICDQPCATDLDCPAALTCLPGPDLQLVCAQPTSPPAAFGASCQQDVECGSGSCAQLWPGDCRCRIACDAVDTGVSDTEPAETADDTDPIEGGCRGCAVGGVSPATIGSWLALVLLLRRRQR